MCPCKLDDAVKVVVGFDYGLEGIVRLEIIFVEGGKA